MDSVGGWCTFQWAADEVERRLGVTWGLAQKTILEWCESKAVRWENAPMGGPRISYNDLMRCLEEKLVRKPGGKQARIIELLRERFAGARVPDRDQCPRQALQADLLQKDKTLKPLNLTTLKKAIESYNSAIPN